MFNTVALTEQISLGSSLFVLVSFLVLMLILKKVAYGPLMKVLDERANRIDQDLTSAKDANTQAQAYAKANQEELAQAKTKAAQIKKEVEASARKSADELVATANERATGITTQAQNDASKLKSDAVLSAKNDVAALSVAIASKLMQKELSLDDHQALIDAYINDLEAEVK